MMNWKGLGRKCSWFILSYCFGICLECLISIVGQPKISIDKRLYGMSVMDRTIARMG
jgi:hypothetical protein